MRWHRVAGCLAVFMSLSAVAATDDNCTAIAEQSFADATGAPTQIKLAEGVSDPGLLPPYCRVVANVDPNNTVEIRLPASDWNGRLLMAGCGGLCGAIQMGRTDDALLRGYAVAHTDMGHAEADLGFASDPQALEDFAHRSTHVATRLLKAVAASYYERPHDYAYFRGCSTGGRQGLTAALLYPDDFDGVVAGAPASGPAVPNIAWALKANTAADGTSILDAEAIEVLHEGALMACDLDDGIADGIIGDPPSCRFSPNELRCSGPTQADCLSEAQVEAAEKIYGGLKNPDGSAYASQGYSVGGEPGWLRTLVRGDAEPGMAGVARNYLRRFSDLPNPPTDIQTLDFGRFAVRLTPLDELPMAGSDGRGLAGFAESGGRLLLYHSWSDDSLTPATAIDVFSAVADPAEFLRLFMIPGMFHCGGGPGPDAVDFLSVIERWVEQGETPAQLTAYKTRSAPSFPQEYRFPLAPEQVIYERPVFAYPASAIYVEGDDESTPGRWIER